MKEERIVKREGNERPAVIIIGIRKNDESDNSFTNESLNLY